MTIPARKKYLADDEFTNWNFAVSGFNAELD